MKVRFNGSAGDLFFIWLGWTILMIITCGLATPFFFKRLMRYCCEHMEIVQETTIVNSLK